MKFTLTLVASDGDGNAQIVTAEVTIADTQMEGLKPDNGAALEVILLRLKEAGMSVE